MTEDTKKSEIAPAPEDKAVVPGDDLAEQASEFDSLLLDAETETGAGPSDNSGEGAAGVDEDFGADLSGDELWDPAGGSDGTPLFDELALEIGEGEAGHEAPQASGGGEIAAEAAVPETPAPVDVPATSPDGPAEAKAEGETVQQRKGPPVAVPWIPWGVAGMSSLLTIIGLIVLWNLASTARHADLGLSGAPLQVSKHDGSAPARQPTGAGLDGAADHLGTTEAVPRMDRIALAPFLIPAQREGEMVFLKLQVEITVADSRTKDGLLKKEAWVRDAIYRELKGIDIDADDTGSFLSQYRRPIIQRLDRELAPLCVEDIRLAGFLMK